MIKHLLFAAIALVFTASAGAGTTIPDDVFARAAVQLRHTIESSGTDQAALLVEQCYRQANEREKAFGAIHATCATQDLLLTTVLVSPDGREPWWPPYNEANQYDVLVPAFKARIVNLQKLLKAPTELVEDIRVRMLFVGGPAFVEDQPTPPDISDTR